MSWIGLLYMSLDVSRLTSIIVPSLSLGTIQINLSGDRTNSSCPIRTQCEIITSTPPHLTMVHCHPPHPLTKNAMLICPGAPSAWSVTLRCINENPAIFNDDSIEKSGYFLWCSRITGRFILLVVKATIPGCDIQ